MRIRLFLFISFALGMSACNSPQRGPSSVVFDNDRANRIQEIDQQLSKYWNNDWKTYQKAFQSRLGASQLKPIYDRDLLSDPALHQKVQALIDERRLLSEELSAKLKLENWSGIGPWFSATHRPTQTSKTEILEIKDAKVYELNNPPRQPFPLEHRFYSSYSLRLDNMLPVPKVDSPHQSEQDKPQYLKARLQCDGDLIYDTGILFFTRIKRSPIFEFNWYYRQKNLQDIRVQFSSQVNRCQFKFYDPDVANTWTHGLELADLLSLSPEWYKLSNQIDLCAHPSGNFANPVDSFFWQQDLNFNTCPQTFDKITHITDAYHTINQRILSLTGSPLQRVDFQRKNPMAVLDFSKAPRFDVIWVSSLNFSADFYGMVLARALRYHAERGTQIRILTADATMKKKDRALVESLQSGVPNVKAQYYRYQLTEDKDGTWFDRFHRVSHTKLLIGYSTSTPTASFLITGGRNIRDSYLFKEAPVYKAYAFLKNYGEGEEPFIFYEDFEAEFRGHDFVRATLAQMIAFWMRDPVDQSFRSSNINIPKPALPQELSRLTALPTKQPLVRHFLSLPYFDGYQMEKFYIKMIDSARFDIAITTPYFRPSVAISAAFDRASSRGVKVQIMTRIHLAGDDVPQIAEDVNKQGINRLLRNVEIYEWTDDHSILHAKLFVVDKRLAFVSSVNLNRRSFLHDVESGALILHEKSAQNLRAEVMNFIRQGRKITHEERISWINSTLIDWADSYF